jgi:hypothetical protein
MATNLLDPQRRPAHLMRTPPAGAVRAAPTGAAARFLRRAQA